MKTELPTTLSQRLPKILALLGLLYLFLIAIGLMGSGFQILGRDHAGGLFDGLSSPFAGLAVGILATVLVQSSSTTTSLIVAAVGAQQMPLAIAVFAIMGCNVGTTITNTLVSLGHVRQDEEFRRAFAGSTMHDFFNLFALLIFMPLEWTTGLLHRTAEAISTSIKSDDVASTFPNPIKQAVEAITDPLEKFVLDDLGMGATGGGVVILAVALVATFFSLIMITRTMRGLMADRFEAALNRILQRSGLLAIGVGFALTVAVQSSSIVTALMVPLFAAGILKLENGFPLTVGSNIGTTVTALLASLATGVDGLTIAMVHLLFNVGAAVVIYPVPVIRRIPVRLAVALADLTVKSKLVALLYVVVVFLVIPLIGTLVFK